MEELVEKLEQAYKELGIEWEGYGQPTRDDFEITISGMVDYLDGVEGQAHVELPNARLVLVRDEQEIFHLLVEVGTFELSDN